MKKKETTVQLSDFPAALHPYLTCAHIYESTSNPLTPVLYCDSGFYIKQGEKGALAQEAAMDGLFARRSLGPAVELYLSGERDYLVTRAARGESLLHYQDDPKRLCKALADALRRLHDQPAADVPLSAAHQYYLRAAAGSAPEKLNCRMQLECFPVSSPEEGWALIQAHREQLCADTLIHGDACLPNIFLEDWQFSAFIDCAQAGLGNRHCDLFWAMWSMQYNLKTAQYSDYLLDAYGHEGIEPELLRAISAMEMAED